MYSANRRLWPADSSAPNDRVTDVHRREGKLYGSDDPVGRWCRRWPPSDARGCQRCRRRDGRSTAQPRASGLGRAGRGPGSARTRLRHVRRPPRAATRRQLRLPTSSMEADASGVGDHSDLSGPVQLPPVGRSLVRQLPGRGQLMDPGPDTPSTFATWAAMSQVGSPRRHRPSEYASTSARSKPALACLATGLGRAFHTSRDTDNSRIPSRTPAWAWVSRCAGTWSRASAATQPMCPAVWQQPTTAGRARVGSVQPVSARALMSWSSSSSVL